MIRVKNYLFPGYNWDQLQPQTLEVINDMVQSMLYDVDRQFKETHQDYKTDDDDLFIPRRSFKEKMCFQTGSSCGLICMWMSSLKVDELKDRTEVNIELEFI